MSEFSFRDVVAVEYGRVKVGEWFVLYTLASGSTVRIFMPKAAVLGCYGAVKNNLEGRARAEARRLEADHRPTYPLYTREQEYDS